MNKKIIEIANDGINLSIKRGFLCIENKKEGTSNSTPLDDILSLVLSSNSILLSKNTINSIIDNGGVIICCGKNYMPASITFPYAAQI
jgi:CRISPR/Cas system-associated endonuclease Cas1